MKELKDNVEPVQEEDEDEEHSDPEAVDIISAYLFQS
jgi:hypothetical protein